MKPYNELTYRGQALRLRRLAEKALAERDFAYDELRFIFHGENTTFRVIRGQQKWLLRIHRPGYQSTYAIKSELAWLRALSSDTDLDVPTPVGGVQHVSSEGVDTERRVVLFEWVDGRFHETFVPARMRRTGRLLATLHEHASSWRSADFERRRLSVDGLLGDDPVMGGSFDLVPESHRALYLECRDALYKRLTPLESTDRFHLIHADLHHGNRLFPTGAEVAAAIDFDDCGIGHELYDLAITLGYPLRSSERPDELRSAFLEGYREIRTLHDELFEYYDAFGVLRILTIHLWVWGRTDNPYFIERGKTQAGETEDVLRGFLEP